MPPEIDYTIASKIQPPQFDPLGVAGKAIGLQQGMQGVQQGILQNRLLGQQIGGKEALGRAITAATDPATGKTDWAKGLGILSQDPGGAFAVPELAASVQERQLKGLGISKEELELSRKRWETIGNQTIPMLATKEPLTRDAVIKTLTGNLIDSGMFNDENSVGMLAKFIQGLPDDDKGLRAKLQGLALASNSTQERINSILGPVTPVDRGPEIIQQQISPVTGDTRVVGVIPKARTPSETATLVPVYNPVTKQMEMKTSGEIVGDAPRAAMTAATGAPLGQAEAEVAAATGGVTQAQALRIAAERAPETKAALQNIRDLVPGFNPGAKTNWLYAAKALATQMGVAPKAVQDEVAAQEEFNKLATQFINQQVGALGGTGTDAKLESAAKGTPNEFMSKEGILNVTALMMGLNDAVAQKNAAWQKWLDAGNPASSYGKFQTQFNQIYNPRVFQSAYMSDAQRQVMMKNMTKAERERFQADWSFAKKAGWLP